MSVDAGRTQSDLCTHPGCNALPLSAPRRRIVLAACASEAELLRGLFAQDALQAWEPCPVETFEEARFFLQHTPCDLVLVDESLYRQAPAGLAWLAQQRDVPVVFLADPEARRITAAYQDGVHVWLPRELSLAHAPLGAAMLERVIEWSNLQRGRQQAAETLQECRRQIDQLVAILWRTAPRSTEQSWLAQREMFERLEEEVARTQRHAAPLAIALGEVHAVARSPARATQADRRSRGLAAAGDLRSGPWHGRETVPQRGVGQPLLEDWTTQRILRMKRRCDVAGQYGLQGFMVLLVHTPQAGARTCCRRLQKALEAVPALAGHGPHGPVRAYFGLASYSPDTASAKSLVTLAEQQLQISKATA